MDIGAWHHASSNGHLKDHLHGRRRPDPGRHPARVNEPGTGKRAGHGRSGAIGLRREAGPVSGTNTIPERVTSSLCVGCGLCCDGTVVSHLAVADDSDLGWPLRMLGVELIVEAEPPVFELPCPAVRDGVCTVYDKHRPSACAQFACTLLEAVEHGQVELDAARGVIRDTIRLRDRVRANEADHSDLAALVDRHFRVRDRRSPG
jgi:Fe-S-cluster containining protein